jgi:polyhydroxyalkanoate synthase
VATVNRDGRVPPVHAGRVSVPPRADGAAAVPPVRETESEVVYAEHDLELHRYEPDDRRHRTPILLVYALVNRPFVLDLEPGRSVVRRLLEAGFRVYLTDWGEPGRLDAGLGLEDYVRRFLANCVEATLADADARDCHLIGYCMGGTMAAIYAALDDEPVRTLSTVAAPIAFDGTGGVFETWAAELDADAVTNGSGLVPAEVLAWSFAMLDPIQNTVGKLARLYDHADDPDFVATFRRMERWIWDGVDLSGTVFREFVDDLYGRDALVEGSLTVGERRVDLSAIDVPHQHLVGEHDELVPPTSTRPLAAAIAHPDGRVIEFPVGHVGLTVSADAHAELWPAVADWLAARSDPHLDRERARATVEAVARRGAREVSADGGVAVDPTVESRPVEHVDGIGATYARRLGAAGVETVAALGRRDVSAVVEITDAPPGTVRNWLDQARSAHR